MAAGVMVAGTAYHRPLLSSSSNSPASPAINSRPAVILPGLGNNSNDYMGLACSLKDRYGIPSVTVQVSRLDWLRNAAGLLDSNYWKGTLRPRPVLDWYLERVEDAINEAKRLSKDGSLSLIGHSAGGWLARVYMEEFGKSGISLLLTLGTPHFLFRPPPKGVPGVIDQTRGLLDYVETYCSKAVYAPHLKYVCISGRCIQGSRFLRKSLSNSATLVSSDSFQQIIVSRDISGLPAFLTNIRVCFIGLGYKQVCGQADVWGDGVVPEMSAHLEGARNVTLAGVYHSPVGSDDVTRPWYGSPAPLDQWVHHLQG